ncbi:nudix hydrolase 20, chloroplastic-like isoform X2 [Telopea speciosissima]|uniref:nudix hydrolase 20, chloroplastic-like isoform X2 n=1 Tax=Telopea speciosissima TaxID=54955 RepID=UPI001CC56C2B|nr:nudix hydrolase 20, chloroplastic-like isoform X2 [Telopea speciosissima]
MACNASLSHRVPISLASLCNFSLSPLLRTKITSFTSSLNFSFNPTIVRSRSLVAGSFSWDDVFRISQAEDAVDDSLDFQRYFERISACNRGSEMQSEFLPFVIEGRIVGYIHNGFADHLRKFNDVFVFGEDNSYSSHCRGYVTLHPLLGSPEDRTGAVGDVIRCLGERLIPGIRNELYPVKSSFDMPVFFSLERAAAPYFGIKAYGVHMNGYVDRDGKKFLWIGKRSEVKPTFPGMLDHLVAGGLPHGITCKENLLKECEEEAGIPRSISSGYVFLLSYLIRAVPVGAVSYMDIDGYRYKRDVLFCYDLKLPDGFIPKNQDGEVESFKLISVIHVANIIRRTQFFKANCALVIIDFLFRHGYISPEDRDYLQLLQSLRNGDCS